MRTGTLLFERKARTPAALDRIATAIRASAHEHALTSSPARQLAMRPYEYAERAQPHKLNFA
jgi:hypothetical protein